MKLSLSLAIILHKVMKMRKIVFEVKAHKEEADQEFKNNGPESSASPMINLMANFHLYLQMIYFLLKIFLLN